MKRPDFFISPHRLEELKKNPETLPKMIDSFLDESFKLVNDIKEFVFEREPLNVMRVAHSLRGFSANAGATYIADISMQIETKAKNDDLSEIETLVKLLEEAYEDTKRALFTIRVL